MGNEVEALTQVDSTIALTNANADVAAATGLHHHAGSPVPELGGVLLCPVPTRS